MHKFVPPLKDVKVQAMVSCADRFIILFFLERKQRLGTYLGVSTERKSFIFYCPVVFFFQFWHAYIMHVVL